MSPKEKNAMSLDDLKREALKLSYDEREALAHTLNKSLDDEEEDPAIEQAIMTEIKRRYHEIQEGTVELLDGEKVFVELLAEFP
jgi:putative addiction module component (TIGR02574 family)